MTSTTCAEVDPANPFNELKIDYEPKYSRSAALVKSSSAWRRQMAPPFEAPKVPISSNSRYLFRLSGDKIDQRRHSHMTCSLLEDCVILFQLQYFQIGKCLA